MGARLQRGSVFGRAGGGSCAGNKCEYGEEKSIRENEPGMVTETDDVAAGIPADGAAGVCGTHHFAGVVGVGDDVDATGTCLRPKGQGSVLQRPR